MGSGTATAFRSDWEAAAVLKGIGGAVEGIESGDRLEGVSVRWHGKWLVMAARATEANSGRCIVAEGCRIEELSRLFDATVASVCASSRSLIQKRSSRSHVNDRAAVEIF